MGEEEGEVRADLIFCESEGAGGCMSSCSPQEKNTQGEFGVKSVLWFLRYFANRHFFSKLPAKRSHNVDHGHNSQLLSQFKIAKLLLFHPAVRAICC